MKIWFMYGSLLPFRLGWHDRWNAFDYETRQCGKKQDDRLKRCRASCPEPTRKD